MFYYLRTYNYRQAPSPAVYNKPNWIHLWCIASHPQQSIVCYGRTKLPSTEVFQSETFASSILQNCICLWEAGLMPKSPDVTDEAPVNIRNQVIVASTVSQRRANREPVHCAYLPPRPVWALRTPLLWYPGGSQMSISIRGGRPKGTWVLNW